MVMVTCRFEAVEGESQERACLARSLVDYLMPRALIPRCFWCMLLTNDEAQGSLARMEAELQLRPHNS